MSEPTENDPDKPTGDEPAASVVRRGFLQRLKTWQAAVLAAVVAVGAVSAALASVLDVKDRLFDDRPPLTGGSAAFTKVRLTEEDASRHAYCRHEFVLHEFDNKALQECLAGPDSIGNIFSVGLIFKGYEGVCCSLRWTLENVTLKTVPDDFADVTAVPDIEPRNQLGDPRIFEIFVPNAAQAGDYIVHFALADRDGTIKEEDSELFSLR